MVKVLLWVIFWLLILKQFSIIKLVLDQMSTTGKQFPLQSFLGRFEVIWDITDRFWDGILGERLAYHMFENYAWGGFTYATVVWSLIMFIEKPEDLTLTHNREVVKGQNLLFLYILFFAGTIIYGLNRDQWVPYVQEPSWEINLVHKQQVSAGTFMIVYYIIWFLSYSPYLRGYEGALNFVRNPKIMTYTFIMMNLDNLASFSWFPGPIDPNNRWLDGYEEIFQEGQTWTSTDKIYHFSMSSVAIIMILMFTKNETKAILSAIGIVIFWELFEIALNPRESSDSFLDMVINSIAIIITAILYSKLEKADLDQNNIAKNSSNLGESDTNLVD